MYWLTNDLALSLMQKKPNQKHSACWLCRARFVEIVRRYNSKMIQLRQKSWLIVTINVFAVRNVHSVTQHIVLISVDTEKLRNLNITAKIHSTILIGYSCQSLLPEHISNHKIWPRWHIFDYIITYIFGKDWGFQQI